jgi:hypothetical protein
LIMLDLNIPVTKNSKPRARILVDGGRSAILATVIVAPAHHPFAGRTTIALRGALAEPHAAAASVPSIPNSKTPQPMIFVKHGYAATATAASSSSNIKTNSRSCGMSTATATISSGSRVCGCRNPSNGRTIPLEWYSTYRNATARVLARLCSGEVTTSPRALLALTRLARLSSPMAQRDTKPARLLTQRSDCSLCGLGHLRYRRSCLRVGPQLFDICFGVLPGRHLLHFFSHYYSVCLAGLLS